MDLFKEIIKGNKVIPAILKKIPTLSRNLFEYITTGIILKCV